MSNGKWVLRDTSKGTERELDSRSEAEDTKQDLMGLGADADDLEIIPPGDDTQADGGEVVVDDVDNAGDARNHAEATIDDRGNPQMPASTTADLPDDPNLTDDPFAWMPGDFVDSIDGTPTINRRGYAALAHKFDISAPEITVHVGPEDTDHEYCRVEACVVDADGREYVNHGSAHTDRGDDAELLLEMATTRARKRALAGATGLGLIAVEELRNEL